MNRHTFKMIVLGTLVASFFVLASGAVSADVVGENRTFIVNSNFDQFSRTSLSATLRHVSEKAYFYVEDRFWDSLNPVGKSFLSSSVESLAQEFDSNIYSKENQFWGSEPNPGIDNDPRITIVLEDLIPGNGGYYNSGNQYPKNRNSNSNERELVFVSIENFSNGLAKIFLAHEFQHLISFHQKEELRQNVEDVWLNELRSEYTISHLGYNTPYSNSNLSRRVEAFLSDPDDSLTEWPNVSLDYAHATLFGEYLVEQYGEEILSETMKDSSVGIESINKFLQSKGYAERFSDVFENWTIANYLNDISKDKHYGYQKTELKSIRVRPIELPLSYPGAYSFIYDLKPWQPTWYKYSTINLPLDKAIKVEHFSNYFFKIRYIDNLGRIGSLDNLGYITNPGGLEWVILMPINESETTDFGLSESARTIKIDLNYVDNAVAQPLKNGDLIKRKGSEPEMYVVEDKYKRYLRPEIIKMYGHLDPSKVIEVDDKTFNSYTTANYVRYVNEKKVYAVWPDGTKHWLNITPQQWDASGRDWNAIFIINELEFSAYKVGEDIKK